MMPPHRAKGVTQSTMVNKSYVQTPARAKIDALWVPD